MRKALILGTFVFLGVLVINAPAGLLRNAVERSGMAALLAPTGTLWHGSGELRVARRPVGVLTWEVDAVTILQGALRYHLRLDAPGHAVTGFLTASPGEINMDLSGNVDASSVNPWLAPYNISLSGTFTLADVQLQVLEGRPAATDGVVTWSGGPVSYELAGDHSNGVLPSLTAYLGPEVSAVVFPTGEQTPLLELALQDNGFARVGVTKLLTRMVGSPWPGADPDHAVVLEVEEQVF